jgi:hypothetical protein
VEGGQEAWNQLDLCFVSPFFYNSVSLGRFLAFMNIVSESKSSHCAFVSIS